MNDYATDEEQVEALKHWWDANGMYVVGGIVLGIAALFGWNWYSQAEQAAAEESSVFYDTLLTSVAEGETDAARAAFDALQAEHAGSTYAGHAWLAMAKLAMDEGDTDAAIDSLTRMLDTDLHPDLKTIARLRLAQVYFYVERYDDANDVLRPIAGGYQGARVDALLGDIEMARGNPDAARVSYEAALAAPPERSNIDTGLVRLKLARLPEPPALESTDAGEPAADEAAENGEETP